MRNCRELFPCLLLALAVFGHVRADERADERAGRDFFESKIRPILVEHCYACHSAAAAKAGKLKGGLQLDTRDGVRRGGESGPIVVVDQPGKSSLILALRHGDEAPRMPPNEKLSDTIIADFETWIRLGLPDTRDGAAVAVKRGLSLDEGRRWWSMIPPRRAALPDVQRPDWPRGAVDRFVLAKLEEHQLAPVGDADRATLLRRVSFDLIGLPPDPDSVEQFLRDDSVSAFANVVDHLLASPRFGERWGRLWLDAARYADSNGRDRNVFWYHAWRYRDYVIASFQSDKPFDQFVREQIAGDLLPAASHVQRDEQRIATGFLALGPKAFEEQKPEIFRMDVIDEQLEVIGRSILGLSIGCARCHDHKFDPIPTRDYYALAGILRSTQSLYGHGPRGIKATQHNHTDLIALGPAAASLGPDGLAYFEQLHALNLVQNTARSDRYRVVRRVADARNQLKAPGADTASLQADIARMEAEIQAWDVKVKAAENEFQAAMDAQPSQPDWAMGARDRQTPEDCRVHIRGETTNLGDIVPRGVLQVLPNSVALLPTAASGRRELADWLTARDNPLAARVFVNRVWQQLFGRGLVATPDDFGVNGSPPSHPELLDDLSVRFMEQGWSVKSLVRELVLSRSYQLSSDPRDVGEASVAGVKVSHAPVLEPAATTSVSPGLQRDPDNVWHWRMSPRRLEVECLRDAMLAVSGQLDLQPPTAERRFLAKLHPQREPEFFNFKPPFKPDEIEHRHRSVYLPVVRGVLPAMFPLFDFAAPDRPVAQRDASTVPAQALFLLNNPWVIGQAQHTARRLSAEPDRALADRIQELYRRAYARLPSSEEMNAATEFLTHAGPEQNDPAQVESRWISFCQAILASAEFRTLR